MLKLSLRLIAIISILLLSYTQIYAQRDQITLKGEVVDEQSLPVPYASVLVKGADNSIIKGTISDSVGNFVLKVSWAQGAIMEISCLSYQNASFELVSKQKVQDFGRLVLEANTEFLEGAAIVSEVEANKVSRGKTTIRPSKSSSALTGNILYALKEVSSISINNNEEISVRGNRNVLILVDGVSYTAGSLSSLPANNVESIDIISSPDASYDAEGSGGVINITTKKTGNMPWNGNVNINYGFNNKVNGNVSVNHAGEKFSIGVNYNIKYDDDIINSYLEREFNSTSNVIKQDINSLQNTTNHVAGLNMAYKFSEKDRINFNLKYSYLSVNTKQGFDNVYIQKDDSSQVFRYNDISWIRDVFDASLGYEHLFDSPGNKLSLLASVSQTKGRRPVSYKEDDVEIQRSNTNGRPLIAALQGDLVLKKDKGVWNTGLKLTYRTNTNRYQFEEFIDNNWVVSELFSNDLRHQEIIPALYFLYNSNKKGRFSYKLGLRAEYSYSIIHSDKENITYDKDNLFISPNVILNFAIDKSQSINFNLSRRITRPIYPQLIPYTNMIDDKTFETGNRDLEPETMSKIDFVYDLKSKFLNLNASLYANYSSNYITQVSTLYKDKQDAILLTYINGDSEFSAGIDVFLKLKFSKYVNMDLGTNFYYNKTKGVYKCDVNDVDLSNSGWVDKSTAAINIMPFKGSNIQIQYQYSSPEYYPQFNVKSNHQVNFSIRQSFLQNKLSASLLITDILNTSSWNSYSYNDMYSLVNSSKNRSRIIWLGLNYNINNFKPKAKKAKSKDSRSYIKLGN